MFLDLLLPEATTTRTISAKILACNEKTRRFGLSLTTEAAHHLACAQADILIETGRIEFGSETLPKLILAFCDSPYLFPQTYPEVLEELTEIFYHYKNETLELISDDDLIDEMKTLFDEFCQGSLDQLRGRALEDLANHLKNGHTRDLDSDEPQDFMEEENE
jgi:hypothetical protein